MSKAPRSAIDQIEFMRNALALTLCGGFVGMIPLFVFKAIPTGNEQLITYMLGQLSGMALTALSFYFVNKVGADALDAKRTDNTSKALDAIKESARLASANAPGADAEQPSGTAGDPTHTVVINTTEDPAHVAVTRAKPKGKGGD